MAREKPYVSRKMVEVDEKEGLRNRVAQLDEANTNLQREIERLHAELNRVECNLRQAEADRDNWRKQALNENARLEGVLERIRTFVTAQNEEDRISQLNMDAFNAKQAAFKALISCGGISAASGGRG